MTRRTLWALLAASAVSGCAVLGRAPLAQPARLSLEGLTLPLVPSVALRIAVQGTVNGRPAEVQLEPASPFTVVGAACAPESSWRTVSVPSVTGKPLRFPLGEVARLELGDRMATGLGAGIVTVETGACFLRLGNDVLAGLAITVDPVRRELSLSATQPLSAWEALASTPPPGRERHLVRIERHPGGDWPLLPVRLRQGLRSLDGVFVLALSQATTSLSREASDRAGFTPALPNTADVRAERPLLPDALALLPGLELRHALVRLDPAFRSSHAVGLLGADAWGRFTATVDVQAGVLLLERAAAPEGTPGRCAVPGAEPAEQGCFALEASGTPPHVGLTLLRDEPAGARVYLQAVGAGGQPVGEGCRAGFTFPPADRGTSLRFPGTWADLARSIPDCAPAFAAAQQFEYLRLLPGPAPACAGTCAFVEHGPTGNDVCRCEAPPLQLTAQERATLEQARRKEVGGAQDELVGGEPADADELSGADEPEPGPGPPPAAGADGGTPTVPAATTGRPALP